MVGRIELRERVRRLRSLRRWDQAELGREAGFSASLVSQIETGRANPTADQIDGMAMALGYSTEFLTAELDLGPTTRPWLRAYSDASKKEADARVAASATAVEYIRLLGLRLFPDQIPDFPWDLDDDDLLEEAAAEVRDAAQLGRDAVVGNAVRAAERLGCVVLPFDSDLGRRHFGMSVRSDGVPIICVANAAEIPGDRLRFTVAHELGHLVLHANAAPPRDSTEAKRMEHQADRFAAAFLAPADQLVETLEELGGRITLPVLCEVKAIWGVSVKGLVGRYKELGVIDADQARSLYKLISKKGWNTSEPVEVDRESAQWFGGSVTRREGTSDLSAAIHLGCQRIGGNTEDLAAFASWEPATFADIVSLDDRRPRRQPSGRPRSGSQTAGSPV